MAQIAPTHENAYRRELDDAEHEQTLANGRVDAAKQALKNNFNVDVDAERKPKAKPAPKKAPAKPAEEPAKDGNVLSRNFPKKRSK